MEKHRERTVKIVTYSRLSQSTESFIRENLETSAALDICGALDGLTDDNLKTMIADPIGNGFIVVSWIGGVFMSLCLMLLAPLAYRLDKSPIPYSIDLNTETGDA
jgi:hypothetical protein